MSEVYRYNFATHVSMTEIEATVLLAIIGTESLHGNTQVRLDAGHYLDADQHACVIDASTAVGIDLNRLFTGFVHREFGPDSFSVERIERFVPESRVQN